MFYSLLTSLFLNLPPQSQEIFGSLHVCWYLLYLILNIKQVLFDLIDFEYEFQNFHFLSLIMAQITYYFIIQLFGYLTYKVKLELLSEILLSYILTITRTSVFLFHLYETNECYFFFLWLSSGYMLLHIYLRQKKFMLHGFCILVLVSLHSYFHVKHCTARF